MCINIQKVIWGLEELADKAEQERIWLSDGQNGTDVGSFEEAFCILFDDAGLGRLLDKDLNSDRISPTQIRDLKRIANLALSWPDNLNASEIIDHPTMDAIRKLSASVLAHIRAH